MTVASPAKARPLRRDAQRNRDLIVSAARGVFAVDGVDVPVEEIARRAGVGMGTLYRRFPTKEDLIDAVLEDALDEFVLAAEAALAEDDAWSGFTGFLERASELHVQNKGVKDVIATREHGRERVEAVRRRMRPLVARLIQRAQEQGALRPDFRAEDMPLLFWTGARVVEVTATVAPEFWRRHLGLLLDGLRAEAASPLPQPPLTRGQLEQVTKGRHR
jgi:AcrR family transcriptional regulator